LEFAYSLELLSLLFGKGADWKIERRLEASILDMDVFIGVDRGSTFRSGDFRNLDGGGAHCERGVDGLGESADSHGQISGVTP
jgi:hypothetical protein